MDTPTVPMPKDAREKDILERLTAIRDQLLLLKQDRTKYIRSQDVMVLYKQVIEQVRRLNEIRKGASKQENRLDKVLESCFQLISLFFMTIGRISEAPAAYALSSTIKRLLDHLAEAELYSAKDMESIGQTLDRLSAIVKNTESTHSPYLVELLANRIELCQNTLARLREKLDVMEEPLPAIYEKMISILRCTSLANAKVKFPRSEVMKFQAQLVEIDHSRVDGHFMTADGRVARGSDLCSAVLERCLRWTEIVLERGGHMPEAFRPTYDVLIGIRNDLEKLSLTQAWSLRETDLYDFQRQLDRIDESRTDGNWLDDQGNPAELYAQRTLLYLIRRSYGYIYQLMISSEPVSEALLPVYNQLQTLKRCLLEVKENGGVSTVRELYPYSMKLHSIDNMRVDGKFMVGNDIPEGQGSVRGLLEECFELSYELRVAAEEQAAKEA